ncbi:MAG TPA: hypothetical protein VMY78_09705 [Solirubrobacteraceae bacterium]|nr:hypothetical protein [Solirubrobacteraceae bacterium]
MGRIQNNQADGRTTKPAARAAELVIEELGDELLVYDLTRDEAHCLGATAARVWRACDGATPVTELESRLGLDKAAVTAALDELERCFLLEPAGLTRRELNIKLTKTGAAVASLPFIVSIAVPAVAAATPTVEQCRAGFTSGCGDCKLKGCCCCGPGNGSTKDCVPTATCGVIDYPLAPKGSSCSKTN